LIPLARSAFLRRSVSLVPGRRATIAALLASIASLGAVAPAAATTGPTPLAHPPRFEVSKAQAAPYIGRFRLVQPLGHRLISGASVVERNERGYVEGTIAIYRYEAAGRPSALVARTYEYHAVPEGMEIDVISPENQVILARMKLHQAGGGKLTGTFRSLVPKQPPEAISLARVPAAPEGEAQAQAQPAEGEGTGAAAEEPPAPSPSAVAEVVARVVRPF